MTGPFTVKPEITMNSNLAQLPTGNEKNDRTGKSSKINCQTALFIGSSIVIVLLSPLQSEHVMHPCSAIYMLKILVISKCIHFIIYKTGIIQRKENIHLHRDL